MLQTRDGRIVAAGKNCLLLRETTRARSVRSISTKIAAGCKMRVRRFDDDRTFRVPLFDIVNRVSQRVLCTRASLLRIFCAAQAIDLASVFRRGEINRGTRPLLSEKMILPSV
jgi:hypothetical protein